MFKTNFILQIFDASEPDSKARFAVLNRLEELPFAPCPGHEFFFGLERSRKVAAVTWNVAERSFTCKFDDEFVDSLDIDSRDFLELVDDAKACGWTLVRIYE